MGATNEVHDEPDVQHLNVPQVADTDGPPRAYFEIPLNTFAPNGSREIHRVVYINWAIWLDSPGSEDAVTKVTDAIKAELQRAGGGIMWWRLRPQYDHGGSRVRLRVGTSPELSHEFWTRMFVEYKNASTDTSVGGLRGI